MCSVGYEAQLNASKTKTNIVFRKRTTSLAKFLDLSLKDVVLEDSSDVLVPDVIFDSNLTFETHLVEWIDRIGDNSSPLQNNEELSFDYQRNSFTIQSNFGEQVHENELTKIELAEE